MNFYLPKTRSISISGIKRLVLSGLVLLVAVTALGADTITVQGQVTDESGEPLIGASVKVDNTSLAIATDIDGNFTLKGVEKGAPISVSYIGYQPKKVKATGEFLNIRLTEDTSVLDEVVVVGYGTQKKVTLTGAVETVGDKNFADRAVSNPAVALQGAAPSLVVTRSSSRPGNEGLKMEIRGATSVNGGSPLLIIDGIPALNYDAFYNLNSSDIESISILKDGAASIYGAKAANGVLLITTKGGKDGKFRVDYTFNMRFSSPGITNYSPSMAEYAQMWIEGNKEEKVPNWWGWISEENMLPMLNNTPGIYNTSYWGEIFLANSNRVDELFANRNSYEHNLSISGGTAKSDYRISMSYSDNQANLVTAYDGQKVFNLRLHYNNQLTSWLKFSSISSLIRARTSSPSSGLDNTIYGYDMPFFPSKNPYGQWNANFGSVGDRNAVAATSEGGRDNRTRLQGRLDMSLNADIYKGLALELKASLQAENWMRERHVNPVQTYDWWGNEAAQVINSTRQSLIYPDGPGNVKTENNPGYLKVSNLNIYQYYSAIARYNAKFNDVHQVEAMAGVQGELLSWNNLAAGREIFEDNGVYDLNLADPSSALGNSGGKGSSGTFSYLARLNYNYDERYLISLLGRRDGDSKFSKDYRFSNFGSVSAGWVFTREKFFEDLNSWWNFGKVRGSYGETGNNAGLGDFLYVSSVNQGVYYLGSPLTGQISTSLKNDGLINSTLTWERVVQKNVGIDLGFFNNRLTATFDYFWKDNKGMLTTVRYPSILGASAPKSNSGHLAVHGWEVTLGWRSRVADFNYFVNFNIGDTHTMLKSMDGADTYGGGKNATVVGYPLNSFFMYRTGGFFKNQDEVDHYYKLYGDGAADMMGVRQGTATELRPGDTIRLDLNGDGKIDWSDGDLQYVGDGNPHYTFGINLGGDWKGIDFSATFQGVGKQYIQRAGWMAYPFAAIFTNQNPNFLGKTWTEENPDAKYPRLSTQPARAGWNYGNNDFMLQNSRYCRLKTLVIGYTLPQNWTRKLYIERLRVYFSGNDLWEISSIKDGFDPEMGEMSQISGYPFARTYSFGVNVSF